MHHSIAPEVIFSIFGIPFYNTFVTTLLVDAVLLVLVFIIYKNISKVPGKLQLVFEILIDYFYSLVEQISGKRVKTIFPWVASFFIIIMFSNFTGLLPGVGSIGFEKIDHGESHLIPLLRPGTSDFNMTLGLALVSVVATHAIGIRYTGFKDYISRFLAFNPIYLFVGILELISEVTKVFSLSFRLFGNIYAGEVVLATISGLAAFIAPIPFLLLESIIAVVQALVFAMLTMVFMSILSTPHHGDEH